MGIKSILVKPIARRISKSIQADAMRAREHQQVIFEQIIRSAERTAFGVDHRFNEIQNHDDFSARVPIRDYEQLRPYIDRIVAGESDITWTGRPKYFAKTSGTTSGAKYIPITSASMSNHFNSARNALFCQATRLNNFSFFDGKMIFLSGSPELTETAGIPTGRLSGIVNHAVPAWLRRNQLPSYSTNCIDDWDEKIDRIIDETINENMTLISGIPPWVKDYFERLIDRSGKKHIKQLFPNLQFVVHGGVNFEPYRSAFNTLLGGDYQAVETYPASEGFIAYQDASEEDGLLLNTNSGIFFEFVPADEIHNESPPRKTLSAVELGVNYAIILSSNAGLWSYNIGDTIEFVSLNPYRIRVTGRIKHFISAFGEHVIAKEVEQAIQEACAQLGLVVSAFTVAPHIDESSNGNSFHEWIIETSKAVDKRQLADILDRCVREQNVYYDDLRNGLMLIEPKVNLVPSGTFATYMRSIGKQGGQNKVPILANDRKLADGLLGLIN